MIRIARSHFFCCFETILRNFFHKKWFFKIKCVKFSSKIVKRFLLKKLFKFFYICEEFSMNTWKLLTFKYVLKIKKLWYFSDNWNKILIVLAIKNSFTIQLLKYDSEFCFFWAVFFSDFSDFFFSVKLIDSEKMNQNTKK